MASPFFGVLSEPIDTLTLFIAELKLTTYTIGGSIGRP